MLHTRYLTGSNREKLHPCARWITRPKDLFEQILLQRQWLHNMPIN